MNRHIDTWLVVLILPCSSSAWLWSTHLAQLSHQQPWVRVIQCMALAVGAVLCFGTAFIPVRSLMKHHMILYAAVGFGLIFVSLHLELTSTDQVDGLDLEGQLSAVCICKDYCTGLCRQVPAQKPWSCTQSSYCASNLHHSPSIDGAYSL